MTADLPSAEFDVLARARSTHRTTTTDVTRALLRLLAADQELGHRLSAEIKALRIEKLTEKIKQEEEAAA